MSDVEYASPAQRGPGRPTAARRERTTRRLPLRPTGEGVRVVSREQTLGPQLDEWPERLFDDEFSPEPDEVFPAGPPEGWASGRRRALAGGQWSAPATWNERRTRRDLHGRLRPALVLLRGTRRRA